MQIGVVMGDALARYTVGALRGVGTYKFIHLAGLCDLPQDQVLFHS